MKIKNSHGFTLIELAVVVIILTLLVGGSIDLTNTFLLQSQIKATEQKMEIIQNALDMYVLQYGKLPCPTGLKQATGAAAASCSSNNATTGVFYYTNTARGGVPYATLNLPPDVAQDGWKNKFTYVVDVRATTTNIDRIVPTLVHITVYNNSTSNSITDKALYAIVSHGKNKMGGYGASNNDMVSTTGISAEELINTSSAASGNFNKIVYSSSLKLIDDMVVYKGRTQIIRDIRLENINCYITSSIVSDLILNRSLTTTPIFTIPSNNFLGYNDTIDGIDAFNNVYQIKCFKYGRLGLYRK